MVKKCNCPECGEEQEIPDRKKKYECPDCGFMAPVSKFLDNLKGRGGSDVTENPEDPPADSPAPDGEKLTPATDDITLVVDDKDPELPKEKPEFLKDVKRKIEREHNVEEDKKRKKIGKIVSKENFKKFCLEKINDRIARIDVNKFVALRPDEEYFIEDLYDYLMAEHPEFLENWEALLRSYIKWSFWLTFIMLGYSKVQTWRLETGRFKKEDIQAMIEYKALTSEKEEFEEYIKTLQAYGYPITGGQGGPAPSIPAQAPSPAIQGTPKVPDQKKIPDHMRMS